jgi:hypothetical protein
VHRWYWLDTRWGADAAIEIANEIAGPVALVAAIDPSRFTARPVPGNVAVVLNYYERIWSLLSVVGWSQGTDHTG